MTPDELIVWRQTYLLTVQQLADLLGVHQTTVNRWERGTVETPRWLPLALEAIAGGRQRLVAKMKARKLAIRRAHPNSAANLRKRAVS